MESIQETNNVLNNITDTQNFNNINNDIDNKNDDLIEKFIEINEKKKIIFDNKKKKLKLEGLIENYKNLKIKKIINTIKNNFSENIILNYDNLNRVLEYLFENNSMSIDILNIWLKVNNELNEKNNLNKLINKLNDNTKIIFMKKELDIDSDRLRKMLMNVDYYYDENNIINNLKLKRGFVNVYIKNNTKYILKFQPNKSYMEIIINSYLQKFYNSSKYILFPEISYVLKNNSYFYLIKKYDNDLFKYLNNMKDNLNEKEIFKIIYFVIKAIRFIHSKKIIYGDLKLENVIVNLKNDKINEIKLIDFDVSLFEELPENIEDFNDNIKKLLINKRTRGTRIYMLKSENMSYKNDVYSLGVFMIILLYKNVLFIINKEKNRLDKNLFVKLKKKLRNLKNNIDDNDTKKNLSNYLFRVLKNRRFKKYWDNSIVNIEIFRNFINSCLDLDKSIEELYLYLKINKFY